MAVLLVGLGCDPPIVDPPPLGVLGTGAFVGEVFVGGDSIEGATIEILGSSARASSASGRQFALYPVTVGTHTIAIRDPSGRAARFDVNLPTENLTVLLAPADTTLEPPTRISGSITLPANASPAGAVAFIVGGSSAEVSFVGDDGRFTIENVPAGARSLAVSKPGYDIAIVSVAPEAGQVLDLDAPLALVEAQPAALPLAGTVKVAGLTDHAGTLVNVDDGAAITTTGTDGSFTVNVNVGRHVLRATRSGFASVVLGTISVAADGGVAGLVPVFLTAGADAVEGEADGQGAAPGLEVRAPLPGTIVPSGVPVVLAADLDNVDGDAITLADVSWHSRPVGETEFSLLGTGGLFSARFSVLTSTDIEIEARVDGVGLVASTLITVTPLLRTGVRAGVSAVQVIVPPLVDTDDDGDFDLDVGQGIPVDVVVSIDGADTNVVWEGPGGLSFTDRLPLGALPTGNHRFTAIIEAPAGLIEGAVVEISVHNVDFTVDVVEPAVGVTSSTTAPLPLRVSISHEFQRAFDSSNVRWSLLDGTFIASGPAASSLNAPTGSQTLLVEVTDVAGHRLQSTRDYVRNPVSFAAAFTAPAPGIVPTVELGDPVAVAVSFAHSEGVAAGDIRVRLTSSISGSLLVNGDEPDFAPNETVNVTLPTTGSHVLTARLTTGVQAAFATATINVIAPFVSARLISPTTTSITLLETPPEVGPDVVFSLADNATPGHEADVRRTWFLDGVEFDGAWGGYGTNVTSETRRSLNMGPYSISSGTFDDPRFAPGLHEVTVWVRLPEVETAGINRCVDTGSASRCLRFNMTTTTTPTVEPAQTIGAGVTRVWSGDILLTGNVTIIGTLVVTPGTNIIAANSVAGFTLQGGSLLVGEPDAAPVTMAMRAGVNASWVPLAGTGGTLRLDGVVLSDFRDIFVTTNTTPVHVDRLTLRAASIPGGGGRVFFTCGGLPASVRNVDVESICSVNISSCPNSFVENVSFQGTSQGVSIQVSPGTTVNGVRGIASADLVGVSASSNSVLTNIEAQSGGVAGRGAVHLTSSANVVVRRLTATGSPIGISLDVASVLIDDSDFTANTDAIRLGSNSSATVMRSRFRNNTVDVNTVDFGAGLLVGNDHGDPNDRTTTAFELANSPVGTRRAVSRAVGIRALIDNPYTGQTPAAVITSPLRGTPIHPEFCLPLEAGLSEDVDVVDCTWTADGQPLILGADGCADHNLANGTHTIALTCDSGGTSHSTTILVDDQRMGGVVRGDQTISGAHIVDTDIIVPAGRSLTLAAGTALTFTLNSDRAFNTPVLRTVRGDPAKVEIAVEGTLHVAGTVQAPVLLSGDVGSAQKSWTGILAGDAATVVLDNAQFRGATFAVSSDAPGTDQIAHADITVLNGLFQGTGTNNDLATQIAFQGACPSVVDGMVVRDINQFMNCLSGVDVDVSGLDVRSASQPQGGVRLFQIGDVRSTAVIALRLRDSTLVSTLGGQVIYSNRGAALANVSLDNVDTTLFVFNRGFTMPKTFNMADSVVRQMFTFFELPTNQVLVERTRFEGGTGLVVGPRESFIVRDCLFNDVDNILDDVRTSSLNVLQVRGSRFLGVAQFLGANDDGTRPTLGYDFTGNDFSGVARIINQANTSSPITFNLGNSFFGTTDRAAIEAVIQDTRTDVSATDTIMGKSDYTGFLLSAPALPNVPQ